MSFIGYWSAPVSIPRVFDTTPCLQHMLEYEDCVGDVESIKTEYLMPTWPTLWPEMENGTTNRKIDGRGGELILFPGDRPVPGTKQSIEAATLRMWRIKNGIQSMFKIIDKIKKKEKDEVMGYG